MKKVTAEGPPEVRRLGSGREKRPRIAGGRTALAQRYRSSFCTSSQAARRRMRNRPASTTWRRRRRMRPCTAGSLLVRSANSGGNSKIGELSTGAETPRSHLLARLAPELGRENLFDRGECRTVPRSLPHSQALIRTGMPPRSTDSEGSAPNRAWHRTFDTPAPRCWRLRPASADRTFKRGAQSPTRRIWRMG